MRLSGSSLVRACILGGLTLGAAGLSAQQAVTLPEAKAATQTVAERFSFASDGPAAKNGRIKQSLVNWCYDKYWPTPEMARPDLLAVWARNSMAASASFALPVMVVSARCRLST